MSDRVKVCVNCLGKGTVRVKHIIDNNKDNFYYISKDCPICHGIGYADNEGENYGKSKKLNRNTK